MRVSRDTDNEIAFGDCSPGSSLGYDWSRTTRVNPTKTRLLTTWRKL